MQLQLGPDEPCGRRARNEAWKDLCLDIRGSGVESGASELNRPEWRIPALLWDLGPAPNLSEPQFPHQIVETNGK